MLEMVSIRVFLSVKTFTVKAVFQVNKQDCYDLRLKTTNMSGVQTVMAIDEILGGEMPPFSRSSSVILYLSGI